MSDYRDYYDEEEKPSPNPAVKLIIGGIIGLLIGGTIGFALGAGTNTDGGIALNGGPRIYLIASTIVAVAIMAVAIAVKRSAMGASGMYPQQSMAMRLVVMGLTLFLVLALGVYFMLTQ